MKSTFKDQERELKIKIIEKKSKPLLIVFFVVLLLFLLYTGGALSVTLADGGMMGNGWSSGISWMWLPSILFLSLTLILAWVIFIKNKLDRE
jgi:hypothetical protein